MTEKNQRKIKNLKNQVTLNLDGKTVKKPTLSIIERSFSSASIGG